jgi:alpha-galactosidase
VEHFKNTYAHCLEPLEGIEGWPISDRPKLRAPGYIKMPGRPKKERTREPTEKPKATKMSRVGTVIRCRKCKGIGHNASTCGRRTGSAQSGWAQSAQSGGAQSAQSGPAHSNQPVVPRESQNTNVTVRVPSTQQDSNARKRKSYTALTHRSESSDGTTTIRQQVIHLLVMFDKFTHTNCQYVHMCTFSIFAASQKFSRSGSH